MSRIASPGGVRQRDPRQRDRAYLGWIKRLPCIACACEGHMNYGVEAAHCKIGFPEHGWRAFGHAEKSHDARATGICEQHHRTGPRAQHANLGGDERHWWRDLGVFPPAFCLALREAYEAGENGSQVVRSAARGSYPFPEGS